VGEEAQANSAPRGMYPGRFDDRGRVKLPVKFQQYLAGLPEKALFVTSLDRKIAQIYPISVWRQNEDFLSTYRSNPRLAKRLAFNAADLGVETEMDAQGRITFPPELRRELGLEEQPVKLWGLKGRIDVLSEKLYEEKRQAAAVAEEEMDQAIADGLM
jgi:MraZ protein